MLIRFEREHEKRFARVRRKVVVAIAVAFAVGLGAGALVARFPDLKVRTGAAVAGWTHAVTRSR